MYKIFINDKPLFLADNNSSYRSNKTNLLVNFQGPEDVLFGIRALEEQDHLLSLIIVNSDLEYLWKTFKSRYEKIEAAGGLVKNTNEEHLLILRNGKWDLPKGKLENSESTAEAAIREVEEECGITNLILGDKLSSTYHTYRIGEQEILKESHWYNMTYEGSEELTPQSDEGIERAEWFNTEQRLEAQMNTYGTINDVLATIP